MEVLTLDCVLEWDTGIMASFQTLGGERWARCVGRRRIEQRVFQFSHKIRIDPLEAHQVVNTCKCNCKCRYEDKPLHK